MDQGNGTLAEVSRVCHKCGAAKPFPSAFGRDRSFKDGYGQCKDCDVAMHLWGHYRLRWDDFQALLDAQDRCCGICRRPLGDVRRCMTIDHDHDCHHPDKGSFSCRSCIRGVLCQHCNAKVLGIIEDSALLTAAVRYLGDRGIRLLLDVLRGAGQEQ